MNKDSASSPEEVVVINGPVLLEMARVAAAERERAANTAPLHCQAKRERGRGTSMSHRLARAWAAFWAPATSAMTGGPKRPHLRQHDEFERTVNR